MKLQIKVSTDGPPCRQDNVRTKSGRCLVAQPSRSPFAESIEKVPKDAYPNQPKTLLVGRYGLREISWPVLFIRRPLRDAGEL
jgi:hypothetical protein